MANEARARIEDLLRYGVPFDKDLEGHFSLGREAAQRLARLGYDNVAAKVGDGYQGWPEHAPFDAIVVTAAPRDVPQPLIDQLKPGGRLVVPVGGQIAGQMLLVLEKRRDGSISRREVLAVRFVPLVDQSGRQQ